MPSKDQIIIDLLSHTIEAWMQVHSLEEIACDEEKVGLLNHILESCGNSSVKIPDLVRTFYEEVYLRDVWVNWKPD